MTRSLEMTNKDWPGIDDVTFGRAERAVYWVAADVDHSTIGGPNASIFEYWFLPVIRWSEASKKRSVLTVLAVKVRTGARVRADPLFDLVY